MTSEITLRRERIKYDFLAACWHSFHSSISTYRGLFVNISLKSGYIASQVRRDFSSGILEYRKRWQDVAKAKRPSRWAATNTNYPLGHSTWDANQANVEQIKYHGDFHQPLYVKLQEITWANRKDTILVVERIGSIFSWP